LPKTLTEPTDVAGIKKAFKKQFFIDVPVEMIKGTLDDLVAEEKVRRKGKLFERAA
jgi:hypothetical protein